MDKSETEIDEMKGMMVAARRRDLNFGFCLGRTYETALLILHRWRSLEFLRREVRQNGVTNKVVGGSLRLNSRTLTLTCEGTVPPNTARQLRFLLREYELLLKIEIIEGDDAVQVDDDDRDQPDGNAMSTTPMVDNKRAEQWAKILPVFDAAVERTIAEDGSNADAIQLAWDGAKFAASEGRYKSAMTAVKKIKPLLVSKP